MTGPFFTRPYFTLAEYDYDAAVWFPDFGDYDRETVAAEIDDRYDSDPFSLCKIVTTGDDWQSTIDAAIKDLNARTSRALPMTISPQNKGV